MIKSTESQLDAASMNQDYLSNSRYRTKPSAFPAGSTLLSKIIPGELHAPEAEQLTKIELA
tara:strand:- start:271 stop:453 length:183 start_codon:yes stop_codon:yes gene_type:complete